MADQTLAALRELTNAVVDEFFGNDTNLSRRLIKATNEAQLLLMVQPPNDDLANHPAPVEPGRVERLPDGKPYPAPAAEGELADLAGCVEARATWLDEGTPEERLLRRVAYVLRQRQAPPHEGEVDALINVLSRIAGMLDFMPDGPPDGLVIHRAIELLRQLTRTGAVIQQQAAVIQQQAAELAECREALRRVRLEQRIPGGFW